MLHYYFNGDLCALCTNTGAVLAIYNKIHYRMGQVIYQNIQMNIFFTNIFPSIGALIYLT